MLQEMIRTPEQLSIDECISSPIANQILDFPYEESLFEETIGEQEVSSTSRNIVSTAAVTTSDAATTTAILTEADNNSFSCYENSSFDSTFAPFESSAILSALLDPQPSPDPEPDILPSASFASLRAPLPILPMTPAYHINQTDQLHHMIASMSTAAAGSTLYSPDSVSQLPLELQPTALYDEKCIPMLPRYLGLEPSSLQPCSFLDAASGISSGISGEFYTDGMGVPTCGRDGEMGLLACDGMVLGPQEVRRGAAESCGVGIYTPGSMQRIYSSGDLQALGDSKDLVARCSSSQTSLPVTSDISTLDDSTYKVGKLSVEERKEKIHRYMKKRNERNFSKKIKYACRKTLADSRPRVRGRFAKNDEFGDVNPRPNHGHLEYDDEEIVMKDEEDILQSSDILAHISGVNSFKYNYTVESWI